MNQTEYIKYSRYRIHTMIIYVIDENGDVVPNSKTFQSAYHFNIRFPSTFQDLDTFKRPHKFTAPFYNCESRYINSGILEKEIGSQCQIAKEGEDLAFQPTPDGNYFIELFSASMDLTRMKGLRIEFSGTKIFSAIKKRKLQRLKKRVPN